MDIINFLGTSYSYILALHYLGFALGAGSAVVLVYREAKHLHVLSWLGLTLVIFSGIGLYIPQQDVLNHSSAFLAKVIVVAVLVLSTTFSLKKVSLVSWITALVLGALRNMEFGIITFLIIYTLMLVSTYNWRLKAKI